MLSTRRTAHPPSHVPPSCAGDDVQVFYEDLSAYDYLDDDTLTDPESGFYGLWYRPAYTPPEHRPAGGR